MRRTARSDLFVTPVGYDDPLEILFGCHRRIERQLETLKRLRIHVEAHGVDAEASAAAQAILAYFTQAANRHHEDEESDLLPLLDARITDPAEHARFRSLADKLVVVHRELDESWARLRKPLQALADGRMRALHEGEVRAFVDAHAAHILTEEGALPELCQRWLDDHDRKGLAHSMAARRTAPRARS
jgi:hemerythrin-like domain-containing protein